MVESGGKFIVSPDANKQVIERTVEHGLASYPGVFTPTEAFRAIRAGATGLKFFPAEVLGSKGIRAIKAVLPPDIPVFAVGGANPDNFAEFFAAGCAGFGLGTYLDKPGMPLEETAARARTAAGPVRPSRTRSMCLQTPSSLRRKSGQSQEANSQRSSRKVTV